MNAPAGLILPHMQRAKGRGRLAVKFADGQSRTDRLFQDGAAKIRIPGRPDGAYEAVLINTAGGLTGGDRMEWEFDVARGAHATLTTQACEKIYASLGSAADVSTCISVGSGGSIAWLPQETILFDGAHLKRNLEVGIAADASALIVEPVIFGRLAMGELDIDGRFSDSWRIREGGKLIHAEEFRIGPHIGEASKSLAALGSARAIATVLLISPGAEMLLEEAREISGDKGGVSFWNGKLLARLVDADAYSLRKRLVPLVHLLNQGAALPKSWSL
jgi:urease accessory protein